MVQKAKPAAGMHLKVISPDRLLYEGMIDSLVVKTEDGYEGFLRGRAPCCKLLAAQGDIRFRAILRADGAAEPDAVRADEDGFLRALTRGGFLYMNSDVIVYADEVRWQDTKGE